MARILVVEDEPRLALAVQRGLQDELHAVDVAHDGADGFAAARGGQYDLLILDLMLPGMPGREVCRRLRSARLGVPILILSARDTKLDIVEGLDAGADDYLTKPFSFDELLARVRALLRRITSGHDPRYRVGPIELDTAAHRSWVAGTELTLTRKEFQILETLVRRPGTVMSRGRLVDAAWEAGAEPESNAVEVHVASLRRKLASAGQAELLQTVRGIGYVIRAEPT